MITITVMCQRTSEWQNTFVKAGQLAGRRLSFPGKPKVQLYFFTWLSRTHRTRVLYVAKTQSYLVSGVGFCKLSQLAEKCEAFCVLYYIRFLHVSFVRSCYASFVAISLNHSYFFILNFFTIAKAYPGIPSVTCQSCLFQINYLRKLIFSW